MTHCKVFDESFWVKRDFVLRYGLVREIPQNATLITPEFANQYPEIKPKVHLVRMLHYKTLDSQPNRDDKLEALLLGREGVVFQHVPEVSKCNTVGKY
jgi:hypothetical protein